MIQKYRKNSDIGIVIGILFQFIGFSTVDNIGLFFLLLGSVLFLWNLCFYAIAKGYKWYIGLVTSLFSLVGLLVLILLPDLCRKKDVLKEDKI